MKKLIAFVLAFMAIAASANPVVPTGGRVFDNWSVNANGNFTVCEDRQRQRCVPLVTIVPGGNTIVRVEMISTTNGGISLAVFWKRNYG